MDRLAAFASSPSKTFFAACAAFIAGVAAHAWVERGLSPATFVAAASAAFLLAFVARRSAAARASCLLLAMTLAGFARFDSAAAALPPPDDLPPGEHLFAGRVRQEPEEGAYDAILIMDRVFVVIDGRDVPLPGRMELRARSFSAARAGDELAWRCRPDVSGGDPAFAGRRLLLAGIVRRCALYEQPTIRSRGRSALGFLDGKRRLREAAAELMPEPESSLLLGLLIGDRRGLPRETVEAFRQTGTSHILAVSGYNVSRVIECVIIALAVAGFRRRAAAVFAAAGVIGFAAAVGGEASVVRAAVMGCTGLLATVMGRRYSGAASIVFAAAAMLAANPFMLRHDVGFRLSFAAVMGLQCLGPSIGAGLRRLPVPSVVHRTCADTLAATVATMPLILFDFGLFPAAGPLVNLLILPFVPWAMAAGAIAAAFAVLWTPAGLPAALVCAALLRGVRTVVESSAAILPAWTVSISAATVIAMYVLLAAVWFAARKPTDDHAQ